MTGDRLEAPHAVWTETLVDLSTVDYLAFPRLIALAEVAWSPSAKRAAGSATPYADTLRFSTNEPGGPTYNIAVNNTVTGENISVSPSIA